MRELTDIDAAYIAGLVDGEGCLSIVRQKNSNCRGGFAYRCGFRNASGFKVSFAAAAAFEV